MDIISYQIGKNSAPQPSGSLSITENGTYDVTEKASAVVNVQGGGAGLPINIASSCPSPFLLNQNNITSNVKYIFPTTTASVVNVNEEGEEIVAARDFTAYSKNSSATSAFTITYANDENTLSSNGVDGFERIGYSVTLGAGESVTFVTKYKCDGTLQTSGISPNAPFMFVGENTVLNNTGHLYDESGCLSAYVLPNTAATYSEYTCSYTNNTSSSKTVIVGLDFGGVRDNVTAVTYFKNVRLTKFAVSGSISVGDEVKTALIPANSYANFTYQWQNAPTFAQYIQSSGSQYIDTGFVHSANTKIELDCEILQTSEQQYQPFFGARNQNYRYNAFGFFNRFDYNWIPVYNRSGAETQGSNFIYNKRITLTCEGNIATWTDGTDTYSLTATGTVNNGVCTIGLLTINSATSTSSFVPDTYFSTAKLYRVKIWDNDTLVRDFVPAISNEAGHINEVCLYDNVTEAYFYNQGSGVFVYEQEGDFTDISGATSSTYTAQTGDNSIRCILTGTGNAEGTITSSSITVNEVD